MVPDSVRPHRQQLTRLLHPRDSPGKNTGVACHFLLQCMKVKRESEVSQSCLTLSDPMDCSLPGSSVHGIFQARVLEWVAISFSYIYLHTYYMVLNIVGLLRWFSGKEMPVIATRGRRGRYNLWVGKILWRRKWQPTPAFLPGESYGQRSLVGYNPQGHKESDTTE